MQDLVECAKSVRQYEEIAAGFRYGAVAAVFRCSFQRLNQYCQYGEIAAGFRYGAVAAGSDHNQKASALLNLLICMLSRS